MKMLRAAELFCQKKKRQVINRRIFQLEEELEKFAESVLDSTITINEYHAMKERLKLLPKVFKVSKRCKNYNQRYLRCQNVFKVSRGAKTMNVSHHSFIIPISILFVNSMAGYILILP